MKFYHATQPRRDLWTPAPACSSAFRHNARRPSALTLCPTSSRSSSTCRSSTPCPRTMPDGVQASATERLRAGRLNFAGHPHRAALLPLLRARDPRSAGRTRAGSAAAWVCVSGYRAHSRPRARHPTSAASGSAGTTRRGCRTMARSSPTATRRTIAAGSPRSSTRRAARARG